MARGASGGAAPLGGCWRSRRTPVGDEAVGRVRAVGRDGLDAECTGGTERFRTGRRQRGVAAGGGCAGRCRGRSDGRLACGHGAFVERAGKPAEQCDSLEPAALGAESALVRIKPIPPDGWIVTVSESGFE